MCSLMISDSQYCFVTLLLKKYNNNKVNIVEHLKISTCVVKHVHLQKINKIS